MSTHFETSIFTLYTLAADVANRSSPLEIKQTGYGDLEAHIEALLAK
jgi:hypothetical protein